MSSTPSLLGRAFLAIALMIGFYAFALTIAAVLLYLPYAEVVYAHRIHFKLLVFCVVGAGIILWSIVPRPDRFVPPGPRLEPGQLPRLFNELTGIAKAVRQPMPAEVFLVPDVNAWVTQRGGVMGFGSRPVMGLGLPLLQILTVTQLCAVLAHEFGHYYGGDTKVGPWIYKTRGAIGRTLGGLAKQTSILLYPFLWYGKMFLRVTHAISRRQELTADALASRTVGSRPLIEGLRAIHGAALAYPAYWSSEVSPVLGAGFHPPLAEGFGRFVNTGPIAEAVSQSIDAELKGAKPDPYDTHPPLRERIAAVENLPGGRPRTPDPPAITLLENGYELETRLLTALIGGRQAQPFKPVMWENVGTQVYLPGWEDLVRENASVLAGATPGSLPELSKNLAEVGGKMSHPPRAWPSSDEKGQAAVRLMGAALAVALNKHGWVLHSLPGELYFQRGDSRIEPFVVILQLASGDLKADAWREQCVTAGISDLKLNDIAPANQEA